MGDFKGTQRIKKRFKDLKKKGRPGLVTFITAGDPNIKTSLQILKKLPASGSDIIELGMPFSDPMADGPAIQASSLRALDNGASMKTTLNMIHEFRKEDITTPIILMGYFNPIYSYGVDKFVIDAAKAGVDGFIIVDLPPEESEMRRPVEQAGLSFIYLVAPTTDSKRLHLITKNATGFIYYVSITGITGTMSPTDSSIESAVNKLKSHTDLPIAVGFGITTKEKVSEIGKHADAVVVGSAFVNKISESLNKDGSIKKGCVDSVLALAKDLARGLA